MLSNCHSIPWHPQRVSLKADRVSHGTSWSELAPHVSKVAGRRAGWARGAQQKGWGYWVSMDQQKQEPSGALLKGWSHPGRLAGAL